MALAAPSPDMGNSHSMVNYMSDLKTVQYIARYLFFTGMATAAVGFCITFIAWAKWFIDVAEPRTQIVHD